ncbi:MAG: hypothetical protein WCG25_00860 [bacterium]
MSPIEDKRFVIPSTVEILLFILSEIQAIICARIFLFSPDIAKSLFVKSHHI